MHVVTYVEAQKILPKGSRSVVTPLIDLIGRLFAVESKAADNTPEQRQLLRHGHSRPVLAEMESLLLQHLPAVLPQSAAGKALHYLHRQWPKLVRYVDNAHWPISNNPCENTVRPFFVGRKNWLFSDTVAGAHASANLYWLMETCKFNKVDPYGYLIRLLQKLPYAQTAEDYETLLPGGQI